MTKPWQNEFPLEDPNEMDDTAVEILMRTMRGKASAYFDEEEERARRARRATERS